MRRMTFGSFLRHVREELLASAGDGAFSLSEVARKAGITPTYLSKIEREEVPPPADKHIIALAAQLGQDPDVLLAMAGQVSDRLKGIICKRPKLFARLLEQLEAVPDDAIDRLARHVRDGKW